MATTSTTYTGNGSTTLYTPIGFDYLDTADVDVYLNGVLQTITTHYSFANATTIEFVAAPANGAVILFDRSTDDATLQATFFPGSSIKAADLNLDFDQVLYIAQETSNEATTATSTAASATTTANTALSQSSAAVSTANTASSNASAAVSTANTASTNASNAVTTANTASSNATTAVNTANSAVSTANSAASNASTALSTANTALTNANSAVTTANTASSNATAAVSTANTASTNASNAVTTANGAVTTANTADTNSNTAITTANAAVSTANSANTTAGTANTNAANAVTTANTASTNASAAVTTANSANTTSTAANSTAATALSTANTALSTANTALSTANTASTNASSAVTTANSADSKADQAIAAVASSINYTLVANVAAIPSSPTNGLYIEIGNSTGLESFTPLAGLPSGFVGDSGLTVRLVYQTSNTSWNWLTYFANNSETRYLKLAGGTLTGALAHPLGAAATPSITFTGDTNTGLYSPGADQVAVATNGTGRLFVDSAGNVAIGRSPSSTFGVYVSDLGLEMGYSSPLGGAYLQGYNRGAGSGSIDLIYYLDGSANHRFVTGGNERLRIDSSGRLLIGTSTSQGKFYNGTSSNHALQVEGSYLMQSWVSNTADSSPAFLTLAKSRGSTPGSVTAVNSGDSLGLLSFQGSDGSEFVECAQIKAQVDGTPGANDMPGRLVFSTTADGAASPTERARIDSSGRVGIGNTVPSSFNSDLNTLVVGSGSGSQGIMIYAGTASTANLTFHDTVNASLSGMIRYDHSSDAMSFWTNGTNERLRIDSSGRVGIGTSSPEPGAKLTVAGGIFATSFITASATNAGAIDFVNDGRGTRILSYGPNGSTKTAISFAQGVAGGSATEAMRIDSSGRLGIGTASPDANLTIGGLTNTGGQSVDAINVNRTDGLRLFGVKWDVTSNEVRFSGNSKNYVFRNGSSEAETARIDSSGRLLVGTSTSASTGDAQYAYLQVQGNTSGASSGILALERGSTGAGTSNNETVGVVLFTGSDGAPFAAITTQADATPGSNDYPGRLVFSTTADGASSPTERMRIDSSGKVGINHTSPQFGLTLGQAANDFGKLGWEDGSNNKRASITCGPSTDALQFHTGTADTERFRITSTGAQSSVIPGGSTLYPSFGCRAWVTFNGTGTVAILASGNVSSITDNGTGDYTVSFTTAMPDANYCYTSTVMQDSVGANQGKTAGIYTTPSSGSCRVGSGFMEGSPQFRDCERVFIAIFR
jgi:hypothetical protein